MSPDEAGSPAEGERTFHIRITRLDVTGPSPIVRLSGRQPAAEAWKGAR